MSNILNLKGVKVFAIVVLAVAILATFGIVAVQQASADCTVMPTLRVGSSGENVKCVQTIVGATADGKFGPMTKAAVMAWQSGHSLTADGVVGPLTAAAMNSMGGGTLPAGCTSTSGYSTTTGQACNTGGGSSLPAGCTSTAGYSPTTGIKCDTTVSSGGNNGPLQGGAGSLDDVQEISSLSGEEVSEGQEDVKVAGWTLTADNGSDLAINAFKLTFEQTDATSSDSMDDYIDSVTVWQGSTKVGSADVDDFSENDGVYSKTINLSGAVIDADEDSDFFVSVDAAGNIDSGDLGDNTFAVVLESIRTQDATGAILTDSTTGDLPSTVNFSFETIATTTGLELKVSSTTGSSGDAVNDAHVVDIDDTSDTNDVPLLAFDLEATGDIQNIQNIAVKLDSVGTGTVTTIANGYSLWMDGTEIDSVNNGDLTTTLTGSTACTTQDTCYINFNDIDFDLADGDTSHFLVKADINDTAADLVDGDTLQATMTATDVDAIEAEDENGDNIDTGDLTGTASADAVAFYDKAIMVELVSKTATKTVSSDPATATDSGTYTINFDVTAFGGDMYIDKTSFVDPDAADSFNETTAGQGVEYEIFKNGTAVDAAVATYATPASILSASGSTTGDNTNKFKIVEGETRSFTLTVNVSLDATGTNGDGFYRVVLGSINWDDSSANADTADSFYTFNLSDYQTPDLSLSDYAL